MSQYDMMKKKGAYLNNYQKEPMFSDGLDEFDESRAVVDELIREYKACQSADFGNYGLQQQGENDGKSEQK